MLNYQRVRVELELTDAWNYNETNMGYWLVVTGTMEFGLTFLILGMS